MVDVILSYSDATKQGADTYFTGRPCKRGHLARRRTRSGTCIDCEVITRKMNRATRKQAGLAPYKASEAQRKLQKERKRLKRRAAGIQVRKKTAEERKKTRALYRKLNKTKPEAWHRKNPTASRRYEHNRRARKRNNGGVLSRDIFQKLMELQRGKCAYCRISLSKAKPNIDHIIPLSKGGANSDRNTQLLCESCNFSKGCKHPIEFMQAKGFLL